MKKCTDCAHVLCECGAYHPTDGTVGVELHDGTPMFRFAQTAEQITCGDKPCAIVAQYALADDAVESIADNRHDCNPYA